MLQNKFNSIPIGRIIPKGYLRAQMQAQADNITDKMESYPICSEESGWLGGEGESWERGPYYVRGLVNLAYTLKDKKLIDKCDKWINYTLSELQNEEGNFGPKLMFEKRPYEWWGRMTMLMAIKDYYIIQEENGTVRNDIIDFFLRYYKFMYHNIKEQPLSHWGSARGADAIYVILWLYEYLNKSESWLLNLAEMVSEQTRDWEDEMRNGEPLRYHVVDTTQGFKQPFLKYKLTGDETCIYSLKKGLETIRMDHGRIDNLPNADEQARENLPTSGTETCAVVEGIHSLVLAGEICGEPYVFDTAESYAYNNLPNCFNYDISGYCYFQLQNQVMATRGTHDFINDHGDDSTIGVVGLECCFTNMHMGYPKFLEYMWMTQNNDTLVLTMYGENEVNTFINDKNVIFEEITCYPYRDTVLLKYKGEDAKFNLKLRVPEWSSYIKVNGELLDFKNGYATLSDEFTKGKELTIEFESKIEKIDWHHNSKYIKKGGVLYCLPIGENWVPTIDNRTREIPYNTIGEMKNYEIYPTEKWNYSLSENSRFEFALNNNYDRLKYTTPDNAPCFIKTDMYDVLNWKLKGNVCDTIENACLGHKEEKVLIPYAYSRLKISVFPKTDEELVHEILNFSGNSFDVDKISYGKVISLIFKKVRYAEYVIIAKEKNSEYKIVNKIRSLANRHFNANAKRLVECEKCSFIAENPDDIEIKVAMLLEGKISAVSKVEDKYEKA